jgi:hypothetical protein
VVEKVNREIDENYDQDETRRNTFREEFDQIAVAKHLKKWFSVK